MRNDNLPIYFIIVETIIILLLIIVNKLDKIKRVIDVYLAPIVFVFLIIGEFLVSVVIVHWNNSLIYKKINPIYKRIKKSISCYSFLEYVFLFFGLLYVLGWVALYYLPERTYKIICSVIFGEKIFLKNVIIIDIKENKYSDKYMSTILENVIISQKLLYIVIGSENHIINISVNEKRFFAGMKADILCRKYWFDDKVLYFEKFL